MKTPINVLFLSNQKNFSGGAPRSLYELISHLDRNRVQPFFASINEGPLSDALQKTGVPFLKLNAGYSFHPLLATHAFPALVKFINQNAIDIVHNNQCSDAYFSWLPAKFTNTPFIIHHRDITLYKSSKFLIKRASANIAISNWQNQYNLSNKSIVIHNAIDPDKFPTTQPSDKKYRENEKIQIVGLIGRLAPDKGQDVLIKAAELVLEQSKNVKFLIVGNDKAENYKDFICSLKNLVNDLGLISSVIFTGYIQNSNEIIPYFDISVIPSRREPFGRTIIESMACAKPVISTNVWGALDIITPETGILIPPDDPQSLADALIDLIKSPERRLQMGMAGRKRVEELFTMDVMMQKIYDLYENVLTEKDN